MLKKLHTSNAPEAIGPYSQAIIYNDILYTSGQIAINPQTGNVESDTIEGQTEQVMKNLSAILNEAGTSFENVIKTTCFLKNMSDFAAFNAVYEKYFSKKPARSCIAVKELPKGALCEIEAIAEI